MAATADEANIDSADARHHPHHARSVGRAGRRSRRPAFSVLGMGRAQVTFRLAAVSRSGCATVSAAAQVLIRPYRGLAVAYVPRGPVLSGDRASTMQLIDEIVRLARVASRGVPALRAGRARERSARRVSARQPARRSASRRPIERSSRGRSIRLDLAPAEDAAAGGVLEGPPSRHAARRTRRSRDPCRRAGSGRGRSASDARRDQHAQELRLPQRRLLPAVAARRSATPRGSRSRNSTASRSAHRSILAFGRHGTYLAAGSNAAGLEHRAAHLLQWHAIRWARERGALTWDLWGIADARGRYELAAAQDR